MVSTRQFFKQAPYYISILGAIASILGLFVVFWGPIELFPKNPVVYRLEQVDPYDTRSIKPQLTLKDVKQFAISQNDSKLLEIYILSMEKNPAILNLVLDRNENNSKLVSLLLTLKGNELLKEGKYKEAAVQFEAAIEKNRNNYFALSFLRNTLIHLRKKMINESKTKLPIENIKLIQKKIDALELQFYQTISFAGEIAHKSMPYFLEKKLSAFNHIIAGNEIITNKDTVNLSNSRGLNRHLGKNSIHHILNHWPGLNRDHDFASQISDWLTTGNTIAESTHENGMRLLSIGINEYNNPVIKPLKHARDDAVKVANSFRKRGFKTDIITDDEVGELRILNSVAMETFISKPTDTFVLYFAGHGLSDKYGKRYLIAGAGNTYKDELIPISLISRLLQSHKGKVYAIIDACFERMNIDLSQSRFDRFQHTRNPEKGLKIFYGSSLNGMAIESDRLQGGIATYTLIDYLKRNAGDINFDKMFVYMKKETSVLAGRMYYQSQTPQIVYQIVDQVNYNPRVMESFRSGRLMGCSGNPCVTSPEYRRISGAAMLYPCRDGPQPCHQPYT